MFDQVNLKTKLLIIGGALTALPLLVLSAMGFWQSQGMVQHAVAQADRLTYSEMDHIVRSVYSLIESHQEVNKRVIDNALNTAQDFVAKDGGISPSPESVTWQAVNQFNRAATTVQLPRLRLGSTPLGQVYDPQTPVPLVDRVQSLLEVTCTVFQRMNEEGDMLRVATNVVNKEGKRAIGTFIPKTEPDGKPNPVVAAVLKGERFQGRAFVVNGWYITAYEPLYDDRHQVTGMLYVGVPQESVKSLRQAVMGIKVGKSGYVYVLDSTGKYVISQGGKRDGEDISGAKDCNGNPFIKEIIRKTVGQPEGEVVEHIYPWQNPEDAAPRDKIVKLMYFKPWDWIIGVGMYTDEVAEVTAPVRAAGRRGNLFMLAIFALSMCAALITWRVVAGRFTRPIQSATAGIMRRAQQVTAASGEVSSSSQTLAAGSSQQAAAIEETSASLEEIAAMTMQNADHAEQADRFMKEAGQVLAAANGAMTELTTAMAEISRTSAESAKIVKAIDGIAFKTNLLALNAAVEAARAGEAGAGFGVVAEEVRNLARQAKEAAGSTAILIEESVKWTHDGSALVARTNEAFAVTAQRAAKAEEMVAEIAAASREQAGGLAQLNSAVADMDQVVQQNAAGAEELAGVAEELTAEAAQMRGIINGLLTMVEGRQEAGDTQPDAQQEQGTLRLASAADKTAGQPRLPLVAGGQA